MIFTSVDFPAPFSPTSACTSPARSSRSTPSSAVTPANRLTIRSIRRTGCTSALISSPLDGVGVEKGERRKEKGERRKEKGERRKEKGEEADSPFSFLLSRQYA